MQVEKGGEEQAVLGVNHALGLAALEGNDSSPFDEHIAPAELTPIVHQPGVLDQESHASPPPTRQWYKTAIRIARPFST